MKPFIDKITPKFIHTYNQYLLKNAPLGWQLQLPTITWIWFLVTLITLPIPFVLPLDNSGNSDIEGIMLITVLIALLLAFLCMYLIIKFNNTRAFGTRVFLNGMKEQVAYIYVFVLCMTHIVFYPAIIDIRKGNLKTLEEIQKEAIVFNKGGFYFMGKADQYRYFPSEKSYLKYMFFNDFEKRSNGSDYNKEAYYIEHVKPQMRAYFTKDTLHIDSKWNRNIVDAPKLYCIENITIPEVYPTDPTYEMYNFEVESLGENVKMMDEKYHYSKYQFASIPNEERLKDIKAFIQLYKEYPNDIYIPNFDSEEIILEKYLSNQFSPTMYTHNFVEVSNSNIDVEEVDVASLMNDDLSIDSYRIQRIHSTISNAKFDIGKNIFERLIIVFHIALCCGILLFIFKNSRQRDFLLMFVYVGLITLFIILIIFLIIGDEGFVLHVIIALFLYGLYLSFIDRNPNHYNPLKARLIMLSNAVFAYAPIFLIYYASEYLELGKYVEDVIWDSKPLLTDTYDDLMEQTINLSLWLGIIFYIFIGSTLYKKVYERQTALPLEK